MEFVLAIDFHIKHKSNVRTDDDYCGNLLKKLDWIVEKANAWNATLLLAGDFFDTPTVPDLVKTPVIEILLKAKKTPITIYGNHCTLFNSLENNKKTSTFLIDKAGAWKALVSGDDFIMEEDGQKVKIAVTRPMVDSGIPQIGLFHGFLNKEDGPNTFLFTDVPQNDPCAILLGHDHVPYAPVPYNDSVIYRIGAAVRGIRNDSELRNPQILRLKLKSNNEWATKLYDIPCIDPRLIFKEKKVRPDKSGNDYQAVIDQIRAASAEELTFEKAISMVADTETSLYLKSVLNDVTDVKASK